MREHCGRCNTALVVKCDCGDPECIVETPVPMCPKCEPDRLAKWNKMHGIKVCDRKLAMELGTPEEIEEARKRIAERAKT